MNTVASVDINAPPSAVFPWIHDRERLRQWLPSIESDEVIEEKPGHVGTRFKQVYKEGKRRIEMEGEITAWEQDRRLGVFLWCPYFEMKLDYTLEPTGDATRLTQRGDMRFKGFMRLFGCMAPLMRKKAQRQIEAELTKLKGLCEAEAGRQAGVME